MSELPQKRNVVLQPGWIAFCNQGLNKVNGIKHFEKGGRAFTSCVILWAKTEEELLALIQERGYPYTPPESP